MNKTLKLTMTAALTALAVVTNTFSIQMGGTSNYLTFTYIPCFIAGIWLGALPAAVVGFAGDLLGNLIHPDGAYNPLIGLATVLIGVIPALIYKIPRFSDTFKLILSLLFAGIICTAGINTFALWLMYGAGKKTFLVYLFARLPFQAIMLLVNGVILFCLQRSRVTEKLFLRINATPVKDENGNTPVCEIIRPSEDNFEPKKNKF